MNEQEKTSVVAQPPQYFLELVKRLYQRRDQILISSNKLVEYAGKLSDLKKGDEVMPLLTEMWKEINTILSYLNELEPHLNNPGIVDHISEQAKILSLQLEQVVMHPMYGRVVPMIVRGGFCQEVNKTQLKFTPKSIKQAFGITISSRDIKLLLELEQKNY